jgi:hypothetical protein
MTSEAKTVEEYLASLPEDRRAIISAVRDAINARLPQGYEEGMQYGGIGWYVPHSLFPAGYHCNPKEPLNFAGLANQKNHIGIHLFCLYGSEARMKEFQEAYAATGKKLDMGKSCLRFKKLDDLALDVITETVSRIPAQQYVDHYTSSLAARASKKKKG